MKCPKCSDQEHLQIVAVFKGSCELEIEPNHQMQCLSCGLMLDAKEFGMTEKKQFCLKKTNSNLVTLSELKDQKLPPNAQRVHFGTVETSWFPRGSLEKNSLSAELLRRLRDKHNDWCSPKYANCLSYEEAAEELIKGLRSEVEVAIKTFKEGESK